MSMACKMRGLFFLIFFFYERKHPYVTNFNVSCYKQVNWKVTRSPASTIIDNNQDLLPENYLSLHLLSLAFTGWLWAAGKHPHHSGHTGDNSLGHSGW